jgi:hypothetical protein
MGWLVGICGYREGGLSGVVCPPYACSRRILGRRLDILEEGREGGSFWRLCA